MEFIMYKYAFLFHLDNKFVLEEDLEKYLSERYIQDDNSSYILSQNIKLKTNNNTVFINKLTTSKVNIYPKESLFIIFTNRVKDIKKFDFLLNYRPINLANNIFVKEIFNNGISKNLTMISLESDENYGVDSINFIGNLIEEDYSFKEFGIFRNDSLWRIKEYAFQSIFSRYSIKIKAPNRIEFSPKMNNDEINMLIDKLILMIEGNQGGD